MEFVKRKAVCMFATDIAARGLDFPDVDWVIQVVSILLLGLVLSDINR